MPEMFSDNREGKVISFYRWLSSVGQGTRYNYRGQTIQSMRACKLDDTGRQFIPYYDVPVMQLHEIDDNTGRSGARARPRAAGV